MFRCMVTTTLTVVCFRCFLLAEAAPPVWLDVPFVKQAKDACGAASIAMVMQYWLGKQGRPAGESAGATEIQRVLYSRKAHGIYASHIERYLRQQGFQTFAFQGAWDDLAQHLQKGRPLMVALKPSDKAVSLHYVVVAGLDNDEGHVLLNDPARRKLLKQDRSSFEKEWSASGNWTLLALPQPAAP